MKVNACAYEVIFQDGGHGEDLLWKFTTSCSGKGAYRGEISLPRINIFIITQGILEMY